MNWLAHLLLSEPAPQARVGNLLPDLLPIAQLREIAMDFQPGIARHRAIDAFTDTHPIVRQSIARIAPPFRRYGGILVDIFYDHLLTRQWQHYSAIDFDRFIADIYQSFDVCAAGLPAPVYGLLARMRDGGWLTSYGDMDGVRLTLQRVSRRLRRPFDLAAGADQLILHYDALATDFAAFFPQLRQRFPDSAAPLAANGTQVSN
jgi:acyl carrier protein phosphodiesterase